MATPSETISIPHPDDCFFVQKDISAGNFNRHINKILMKTMTQQREQLLQVTLEALADDDQHFLPRLCLRLFAINQDIEQLQNK